MTFLTPILVLSGICLVLGVLLVLADRFLADYGECRLTVNGDRELVVQGGGTVLSALAANRIFIPSACGGKATCGLCKGRVTSGAGPLLPTERPFMSKAELADGTRLLCQVKVKCNLEIVIPEQYFLVKEFRAVVERIVPLTHDTRLFRFRLLEPDTISFKPGQYVQFRIPRAGEERAYSIASSPSDTGVVELIVRLVPGGLCTTYLFSKLAVRDEIILTGPYGEFFLREDTDSPVICVAGGSGSAPIRSIITWLSEQGSKRPIRSFYGGRTPRDIYLTDYYSELAERLPDFRHIPAISEPAAGNGWTGETGLITEVIERHIDSAAGCEAYLCGPPAMLHYTRLLLVRLGMDEDKIYFDEF